MNDIKNKKFLITGGNGYIGENLKNMYNEVDFDICDKTLGSYAENLTIGDLMGYEGIVHLAALSGIFACENDPVLAVKDNILSAENVFKIANTLSIPVVFTSSQAVKDPTSSKYAFMKWTIEQIAKLYKNVQVIRLSNVYGGDSYLEKKQTCVKQFITQYRNNELLVIHGSGDQKRDFIHVKDVCEAIIKIFVFTPMTDPIDIGTGKATSILELKDMFPKREFMDDFIYDEVRSAGAESSIADTSVAEDLIYFKAKRKLEDYIRKMIK